MKFLNAGYGDNLEEATLLAIHCSGQNQLLPEATTVFTSFIDSDTLTAKAEKSIGIAVRNRYGSQARCRHEDWFIPLPQPGHDTQPIPQLTFSVQPYLVARLSVYSGNKTYQTMLAGPVGSHEKVILPIPFLQSLLDDRLDQLEIAAKNVRLTSWNIAGIKEPVRLPNDFVSQLAATLKYKSVSSWLLDFGHSGESVFCQVAGSLLGLQSHGVCQSIPLGEQLLRRDVVIAALTRMYGSARAAEMFKSSAPYLASTMTNDEAVRLILKK